MSLNCRRCRLQAAEERIVKSRCHLKSHCCQPLSHHSGGAGAGVRAPGAGSLTTLLTRPLNERLQRRGLALGKALHPRLERVFVFIAFEFTSGLDEALRLRSRDLGTCPIELHNLALEYSETDRNQTPINFRIMSRSPAIAARASSAPASRCGASARRGGSGSHCRHAPREFPPPYQRLSRPIR